MLYIGWKEFFSKGAKEGLGEGVSADQMTAIENLAIVAKTLKDGTVTIPGNVVIDGTLQVKATTDADVDKNKGALMIGDKKGEHIFIDGNEILAMKDDKASTLYLNYGGGGVKLKGGLTTFGTASFQDGATIPTDERLTLGKYHFYHGDVDTNPLYLKATANDGKTYWVAGWFTDDTAGDNDVFKVYTGSRTSTSPKKAYIKELSDNICMNC